MNAPASTEPNGEAEPSIPPPLPSTHNDEGAEADQAQRPVDGLIGDYKEYDAMRKWVGLAAMLFGGVWSSFVLWWLLNSTGNSDGGVRVLSWPKGLAVAASLGFGFGVLRLGDRFTTPLALRLRMSQARVERDASSQAIAALRPIADAIVALVRRQ